MDFSSFLGEKRWEILEMVARWPSSPMEIAERLSTTVSYVSQQLKLLEVAGFVFKTRTGAASKGKPRNVYSIKKDFVHLSGVSSEFTYKKILYMNDFHKSLILILAVRNEAIHESLVEFYFKARDVSGIKEIYVDVDSGDLVVVGGSREIKTKIDSIVKKLNRRVYFDFVLEGKVSEDLVGGRVLIFKRERVEKGGLGVK